MRYTVLKYSDINFKEWNAFISESKNGTFLFHRDFMEYHSYRFDDFSLLVFDSNNLVGVFPANKENDTVFSHQGLTYGGLILKGDCNIEDIEEMFGAIIHFLKEEDIVRLIIKQVPSIYHKKATYEMDFVLLKAGASLYRRDMNLAIDFSREITISKSKLKHFRRISNLGLQIKQDNDFGLFWDKVLVPRLNERYNVNPVHSSDEIQLLHNRFPTNILQYNVYLNEEIIAGITLFHCGNVIKSQYGATTQEGEKFRALDYVFISLIEEFKHKVNFFDMGTVNENNGTTYNKGLLNQKKELGCSIYPQDFYSLRIN